ncbi:hypothetical protein GCM10022267_91490 [Lentzea roselyniae]|uniref:Sigma-70, region 4 n=1 Tax=Lentzea roselyniae TaxID=531940 RepID=A0ABP7CHZ7_9PSEU
MLLDRQCPQATRDAVWRHLVLRARSEEVAWRTAAVGMALPALISASSKLTSTFVCGTADVHSEIVTGFLAALATVDLRRPRIMLRLKWAAYRVGHAALVEARNRPTPAGLEASAVPVAAVPGHPDLVLARAAADGVLSQTDADLIGATRLEGVSVTDWAEQHNMSQWATYKARQRAEERLRRYLAGTWSPQRPCTAACTPGWGHRQARRRPQNPARRSVHAAESGMRSFRKPSSFRSARANAS